MMTTKGALAFIALMALAGCGDPPTPAPAEGAATVEPAGSIVPDAVVARALRAVREIHGARVVAIPSSTLRGELIAPGDERAHEGWSVVFALAPQRVPAPMTSAPEPVAAGGLPANAHPPGLAPEAARAAPPPREPVAGAASSEVLVRVRDDGRTQVMPLAH